MRFSLVLSVSLLSLLVINGALADTLWSQNWGDETSRIWNSAYDSADPTAIVDSQLLAAQFTIPDTSWDISAIVLPGGGPTGSIDTLVRFYNDASGSVGSLIVDLTGNSASCEYTGVDTPTICTINLYSTGGTYTLDTGTYWVSWATDASPPTWYVVTDDDGGPDSSIPLSGLCGADLASCSSPHLTPGAGWTALSKYASIEILGTAADRVRASLTKRTTKVAGKKKAKKSKAPAADSHKKEL